MVVVVLERLMELGLGMARVKTMLSGWGKGLVKETAKALETDRLGQVYHIQSEYTAR